MAAALGAAAPVVVVEVTALGVHGVLGVVVVPVATTRGLGELGGLCGGVEVTESVMLLEGEQHRELLLELLPDGDRRWAPRLCWESTCCWLW